MEKCLNLLLQEVYSLEKYLSTRFSFCGTTNVHPSVYLKQLAHIINILIQCPSLPQKRPSTQLSILSSHRSVPPPNWASIHHPHPSCPIEQPSLLHPSVIRIPLAQLSNHPFCIHPSSASLLPN